MQIYLILLIIVSLLSALLFSIRVRSTRSYSLYGKIASRLFLALASFGSLLDKVYSGELLVAMITVAFSDVVHDLITVLSKRYADKLRDGEFTNRILQMETRYNRLLEKSPLGIFILDRNTFEIEYVNKALMETISMSKEDLIGKNFVELFDISSLQKACSCGIINIGKYKIICFPSSNGHETITGYLF